MIHSSAIVSPNAVIGQNVSIGPFTIIHPNVQIGEGTRIGSHCEIGVENHLTGRRELVIGANSLIRSHSVFYSSSDFGDGLVTGHRVTVRERTNAGLNLQIGTLCDIQGHCEIGNFVRFHSNVHIGQKSKLGSFVWIFPYVVLTNDPHPPSSILIGCVVEDYAAIATMSVVMPGVRIGHHSLVGAHSLVARDVKPATVVAGRPATFICAADKIKLKDGTGRPAYPWTTHFKRGYPDSVIASWEDASQ
jgi:acyl-[acyl carrier protein]--UDP-N-acetylglucosamine O-acyltransferase